MITELKLSNFGCIFDDVPADIFNMLKEESGYLESQNKKMVSGLTGNGVSKHFYMREENRKRFLDYIMNLKNAYLATYPEYLSTFRFLSDDVPFVGDCPWYNIQNKYDFLPNHIHDGVLSYSLWIKIPYDVDEETANGKYASCFEFNYSTITGHLFSELIRVDKSYEGKIMMFPSSLMHCVYPFYTTDDTRISLSGNILFDTLKSKL